ncbi:T9SS type A sorting domain-containing protein [Flavihumibacter petaseus]|uniref:Secretion system C-terminal sorting domain-containing protein n=1 Tax=Flavihumibacter petaseus NBRC 106054 TaxID=1220578 RepID=A0A0E9N0A7_9BACT|nr:T9SS type A sorting domain-containing protein [Flavihumibacter petaseus]GAO43213.1 hypothetical protein FPE01S_02_03170 [Flavihumibacter petaseus NBRC 106054]
MNLNLSFLRMLLRNNFLVLLSFLPALLYAQPGSLNPRFANNGFRLDYIPGEQSNNTTIDDILVNNNADTYSVFAMAGGTGLYKRSGDGTPSAGYGTKGFSDCFSFGRDAHLLLADGSALFAGFLGIEEYFSGTNTGDFVLGKLTPQGKIDNQYGTRGIRNIFPLVNTIQPEYLGKLPNGKLLVMLHQQEYGNSKLFTVVLSAEGDYDPALPNFGITELAVGQGSAQLFVVSINQQQDGKSLIALNDNQMDGTTRKILIRINQDGSPDPAFGNAGIQYLDAFIPDGKISAAGFRKYGGYIVLTSSLNDDSPLRFSRLLPNGSPASNNPNWTKLVSLPFTSPVIDGLTDDNGRFSLLMGSYGLHYLVKLDEKGIPDMQFNGTGWLQLNQFPNDWYYSIALTPRKNLMVAGSGTPGTNFMLGKITPSGIPDRYYDRDGYVAVTFPFQSTEWKACIKLGEKGLLAGATVTTNGQPGFLIKAVDTEGKDIKSFGNRGSLLIPLPEQLAATSIIPYGNNHFLFWHSPYYYSTTSPSVVTIKRYTNNGQQDLRWGNNGERLVQLPDKAISIVLRVLRDNRILVGFSVDNDDAVTRYTRDAKIWCLKPDGSRDWNFGDGGTVTINLKDFQDEIEMFRQQKDGKILVISNAWTEDNPRLAITRLLENGKPDPAYVQGIRETNQYSSEFRIGGALLLADNSLFIAGDSAYAGNHFHAAALLKFRENGTRATEFANQGIFVAPISQDYGSGLDINDDHGKLLFTCIDRTVPYGEIIHFRLLANGKPDKSFGIDGSSTISYSTGFESVTDTKLFSDQLIMIGSAATQIITPMLASIALEGYSALRESAPAAPATKTFRIYPNPATTWIQLEISGNPALHPTSAELFDAEGRLVQQWKNGWENIPRRALYIGNIPAGNYLMRVRFSNDESRQEKIVILH